MSLLQLSYDCGSQGSDRGGGGVAYCVLHSDALSPTQNDLQWQ